MRVENVALSKYRHANVQIARKMPMDNQVHLNAIPIATDVATNRVTSSNTMLMTQASTIGALVPANHEPSLYSAAMMMLGSRYRGKMMSGKMMTGSRASKPCRM